MKRWKEPKVWLYGLVAGIIGGAATAAASFMSLNAASTVGLNVKPLDLEQLGWVLLISGLVNAFSYLKQSPLPPLEEVTTTVTVQSTSITTTTGEDEKN